jgi:hypothetical protein
VVGGAGDTWATAARDPVTVTVRRAHRVTATEADALRRVDFIVGLAGTVLKAEGPDAAPRLVTADGYALS